MTDSLAEENARLRQELATAQAAALTPTINDVVTFYTADGFTWREVSRSQN